MLPVAWLYGLITLVRNRLYDANLLKQKAFDVHTIGVGNLSVGGAGKTPLVEYLIKLLLSETPAISTLSRGYKRKTSGFVLADSNSNSDDIGDEPLIYASKYPITVAVDGNRVRGVKQLLALPVPPKIVLLDDVFQHRALRCGLMIVVSEFSNLYFNDWMLPAGTLREFKGGINRADIIVISKTPENTSPVEIRNILKDIQPKAHQHVFFSYLNYGDLYAIDKPAQTVNTIKELYRYRLIVFTGIVNAKPMLTYLSEYAADVRHLPFPDHYDFSEKDLVDIERYYHSFEGGNKLLVTTEKDLMRLRKEPLWSMVKTMNIFVLPVAVSFKDKEEEFNALILKYVRTNRIHHHKYT